MIIQAIALLNQLDKDDNADMDVEGEDDGKVDGEGEVDSFVLLLPINESWRGDCISCSSVARATPTMVATMQQQQQQQGSRGIRGQARPGHNDEDNATW